MYNRKSERPRIELSVTPALTGYSCEDFPSRTTRNRLLLRKYLTWNCIRLTSVIKSIMPNPVEILRYIKCYSSGNVRIVKTLAVFNNFQKICS